MSLEFANKSGLNDGANNPLLVDLETRLRADVEMLKTVIQGMKMDNDGSEQQKQQQLATTIPKGVSLDLKTLARAIRGAVTVKQVQRLLPLLLVAIYLIATYVFPSDSFRMVTLFGNRDITPEPPEKPRLQLPIDFASNASDSSIVLSHNHHTHAKLAQRLHRKTVAACGHV